MTTLEQLMAKRDRASARLKTLDAQIHEEQKKTPVTCPNCKITHEIGSLTYIATHWYVHPYSCTGGDYWNEGDGEYDCPSCKARIRLYTQPEIMAMKYCFKDVKKEYNR